MTLSDYLRVRSERLSLQKKPRSPCLHCRKPKVSCYCSELAPFFSDPQFVILMHPREVRRSIATGRMAHRCLANSLLYEGADFSQHEKLNALLYNPECLPKVLYPGPGSIDLSRLTREQKQELFPDGKKNIVLVIDGTWAQARQMMRLSENLQRLPKIRFTPEHRSRFEIRKQPEEHCYSTIESIHEVLKLLHRSTEKQRSGLLSIFTSMVKRQKEYVPEPDFYRKK